MRLVQFSDVSLQESPVYVDADVVRCVLRAATSANSMTAIYQQDSDTPILVKEGVPTVVQRVMSGGSNG